MIKVEFVKELTASKLAEYLEYKLNSVHKLIDVKITTSTEAHIIYEDKDGRKTAKPSVSSATDSGNKGTRKPRASKKI